MDRDRRERRDRRDREENDKYVSKKDSEREAQAIRVCFHESTSQ